MFIFANNMQQSLSGLRALILTEAVRSGEWPEVWG